MGQKRKEKRLSALDELTSTYCIEDTKMPKIIDTGQPHPIRDVGLSIAESNEKERNRDRDREMESLGTNININNNNNSNSNNNSSNSHNANDLIAAVPWKNSYQNINTTSNTNQNSNLSNPSATITNHNGSMSELNINMMNIDGNVNNVVEHNMNTTVTIAVPVTMPATATATTTMTTSNVNNPNSRILQASVTPTLAQPITIANKDFAVNSANGSTSEKESSSHSHSINKIAECTPKVLEANAACSSSFTDKITISKGPPDTCAEFTTSVAGTEVPKCFPTIGIISDNAFGNLIKVGFIGLI